MPTTPLSLLSSSAMRVIKARMKNGEVVLDNPDEMPPDGTELTIYRASFDRIELTADEAVCLHRSIQPGMTKGDIRALIDVIVKQRR